MDEQTLALLIVGLIGAGGAIGQSIVSNRFARRAAAEVREEERKAELQDAYIEYLRSIDTLANQAFVFPEEAPKLGPVSRAVEKFLGNSVTVFVLLLQRVLFGSRLDRLVDDFVAANARLVVIAEPALIDAMDRIKALIAQPNFRRTVSSPGWAAARRQLVEAFKGTEALRFSSPQD